MRQFIAMVQQAAPSFEQIEEMIALINAPNRSRTSSFPAGVTAVVEGNWIVLEETQRVER
jgi:tRNA(Ile)-lysidine synthase